ncbi:MAG: hypothetical protein LH614_01425 [Pyrinomonadaceae bacterium]|nr:hypothetical protein [Pyrinomonadaceae bacterium]
MNCQVKIKVIKKNAAQIRKTLAVREEILTLRATRQTASTVSIWVNEFQQRRRAETRQALNLWSASIENTRQARQSV